MRWPIPFCKASERVLQWFSGGDDGDGRGSKGGGAVAERGEFEATNIIKSAKIKMRWPMRFCTADEKVLQLFPGATTAMPGAARGAGRLPSGESLRRQTS